MCALAASVTLGGYSVPSSAAPVCDGPSPAIWPFLPELPKGCQRERIQASGELSFNVFRKADKIAEAAWQREVMTKYGERFQDFNFAACKSVLCVKGAVSGTERCTISAYPCASDMGRPQKAQSPIADDQNSSPTPPHAQPVKERRNRQRRDQGGEKRSQESEIREDRREDRREERIEDRDLNPQEVRELQYLLNRAGYGVTSDGVFGDDREML